MHILYFSQNLAKTKYQCLNRDSKKLINPLDKCSEVWLTQWENNMKANCKAKSTSRYPVKAFYDFKKSY